VEAEKVEGKGRKGEREEKGKGGERKGKRKEMEGSLPPQCL